MEKNVLTGARPFGGFWRGEGGGLRKWGEGVVRRGTLAVGNRRRAARSLPVESRLPPVPPTPPDAAFTLSQHTLNPSLPTKPATSTVLATGKTFNLKPLGDAGPVIDAGGIFDFARAQGMIKTAV